MNQGLVIRDSRVKFEVSRKNILQETTKSPIVITSRARIYIKIPQTALNFTQKTVYDLLSSKNRTILVPQSRPALNLKILLSHCFVIPRNGFIKAFMAFMKYF